MLVAKQMYTTAVRVVKGRVEWADRDGFLRAVRAFTDCDATLTIEETKPQRTRAQNAYIHKWPIPLLADYFGDTIEGTKYDLMGECFGWVPGPASGKLIPVKPSTSDLTVEEMTYFIDWVVPWAAQTHGVIIPLPNEKV